MPFSCRATGSDTGMSATPRRWSPGWVHRLNMKRSDRADFSHRLRDLRQEQPQPSYVKNPHDAATQAARTTDNFTMQERLRRRHEWEVLAVHRLDELLAEFIVLVDEDLKKASLTESYDTRVLSLLEGRSTDVPEMWRDKPESWWRHVAGCEDCSRYHHRPAGMPTRRSHPKVEDR